jgi:NAD dependent epimerase/dehydratase family enzyme
MSDDAEYGRRLRIVIPGGSGNVGRMLADTLQERGHQVTVLTRGPYTANWQTVHWDGEHVGPWTETLEGADACINLAGRSVNCRYTEANREAIYESRIQSTRLLNEVMEGLANPPRVWLNASATTIYQRAVDANGIDGSACRRDMELDEAAEIAGDGGADVSGPRWAERRGFIARLVRDWEVALFRGGALRTRKIALRTGIVLNPTAGSVFGVLSNLTRAGLGGTAGNGRQFVSWIHEADYARAVEFLIAREDLEGPFNMTAPEPLTNREFMAGLREAWERPNGLPAPAVLIKLGAMLVRTEPELVLGSCRAVPGRLLEAGFRFEFPEWGEAAADLVRLWRQQIR